MLSQSTAVPAAMSAAISLMAAVTLTGKSKRTLWRRLGDGTLPRAADDAQGRTLVPLSAIAAEACLPLSAADWSLVLAADGGDAQAQLELAHVFLAAGQEAGALYWLEAAARQQQPDAMQCLARLIIEGRCTRTDPQDGMVWLARSAALGHAIARAQMDSLQAAAGISGAGYGWAPARSAA